MDYKALFVLEAGQNGRLIFYHCVCLRKGVDIFGYPLATQENKKAS